MMFWIGDLTVPSTLCKLLMKKLRPSVLDCWRFSTASLVLFLVF